MGSRGQIPRANVGNDSFPHLPSYQVVEHDQWSTFVHEGVVVEDDDDECGDTAVRVSEPHRIGLSALAPCPNSRFDFWTS